MQFLYRGLAISLALHILLLLLFRIPSMDRTFSTSPIWIELKDPTREIVDIMPPEKQERPKDSKFLGLYDSRVEQETVAGGRGDSTPAPSHELYSFSEKIFLAQEKRERERSEVLGNPLPEDFYPDFQRGPHTYLNVLRFPDCEYFVRLKRIFKLAWNPSSALRDAAVTSRIARGNLEVVLGVSIDNEGELAELFVHQSSGIREYDNEALRAVRSSAPFAVPPEKLLAGKKELRMSWSFIQYL